MKKCQKGIPERCYWLVLPCLWVSATQVFPSIRIPFSLFGENETLAFNAAMWTIADSYLAGIIVYYLTVTYKNRRERRRRKWELDNLSTILSHTLEPLEGCIGRFEKADHAILKNGCTDEIFSDFTGDLAKELDKASLYKDILTEKENNILTEVRRLLSGLTNPPSKMDNNEAQRYLQSLIEIRTNIDELQESIDLLFGRKHPGLPSNK